MSSLPTQLMPLNHQCCSSGSHSVPHCLAENIIALSEPDSAWMPLKSNEGKSYIKGPSYYCKCIPKITLVVNYFIRAPSFTVTRLCFSSDNFLKYKCIVNYLGCALKWRMPGSYPWQVPVSLKGAESLIVGSCWAVLELMIIGLKFENTDVILSV